MNILLKGFLLSLANQGEIIEEQPQAIIDRFKRGYKPLSDLGANYTIYAMRILNPAVPCLGVLFVRDEMMVDAMHMFAEEMLFPDVDLEWIFNE